MLIPIDQVVWDPKVYPRAKWSTDTIKRYADAHEAGDEFPDMILEKGTNRLLDGKHRLEMYKLVEATEVAVEYRTVPEGVPVKLFAASLSARHGDRLENADIKTLVREVYTDNPEYKQADVEKLLGVSQQRVSEYVSDILAKRREDRKAKALRLSLLGWTLEEIGERLGIKKSQASEDISGNTDSGIFGSGHTPEDISLRTGLPIQVVLALQFKDLDDAKRLDKLDIKLQPYDVWHFPGCHDLMGDQYPGRIPGGLLCHVLYFYTKQGDLVIDPMAGSGTTLDACLLMGRKARGYDLVPFNDRVDIETHSLDEGWPEKTEKASLVFWDPPYFAKKNAEYPEGSVSELSPEDYLAWFAKQFKVLHETVRPGTRLAFLMSDWDPEGAKEYGDHPGIWLWDYARLIQKADWTIRRHIQIPLSTQQVHPDIVNKFRASRRLARLERYLLVAEA